MPKSTSRRIQVLSCLIIADWETFDALLPVLTRKDLVRLVGLLQQSMLEEQRRFNHLSQCLQTFLDSNRAPLVDSSNKNKNNEFLANTTQNLDLASSDSNFKFRPSRAHFPSDQSIMENMISIEDDSRLYQSYTSSNGSDYKSIGDQSIGDQPNIDQSILEQSIIDQSINLAGDSASISEGEINMEDTMRAEQLHGDYLTRELILSQSRLAQLCAKNMKICDLQEQHRQRYELDHSRVSTSSSPLVDHCQDHISLTSTSSSSRGKSLSTLHKEKKLKELSDFSDSKTDQDFQYVLTDIFSGNGSLVAATNPIRTTAEISPESGYNSSSSLKSPVNGSSTRSDHQDRQSEFGPRSDFGTGSSDLQDPNLQSSSQRILEQVRSRRSSAPPVQTAPIKGSINRTLNDSPRPSSDHQRPLKSILKKRQTTTDNECRRSVEIQPILTDDNQNTDFWRQSKSPLDNNFTLRENTDVNTAAPMSVSSNVVEEEGSSSALHHDDKMKSAAAMSYQTSTPSTVNFQRSSPVPLMASRAGPSEMICPSAPPIPDSPGPYLHHVDYPSPVRNGSSTTNKENGDLPDLVVLKLDSTQLHSPKERERDLVDAVHVGVTSGPKISDSMEKAKILANERSSISESIGSKTFQQQRSRSSHEEDSASTEYDAFHEWDPIPLLRNLYEIHYEARPEERRQRFQNMEGHLEHLPMNIRAIVATDTLWKSHYFRTKEGKLQWFENGTPEAAQVGEMNLSSAELDVDKNACILVVQNPKEGLLTIRYPPELLDKWRSALLNHASATSTTNFVRPIYPPIRDADQHICIIEIGSCSIRAGVLTTEASLPQSYFPSIACSLPDGTIIPGFDALSPSVRHGGTILHPIKPTQVAVNRYSMDLEIVKHLFRKVFDDLRIDSNAYQIMLSVPQNAPIGMVGDMIRALLTDFGVRGVFVSRQPFLILYSYDVTTGVVVDFGDRLNIVPVIDGYVVQSAIVSLPYGGHNVCEGLRSKLIERNWTPYSFMSELEKYLLRYIMEKACYVAADFDEEAQRYDRDPSSIDTHISIEKFQPTPEMPKGFDVDSVRFTSTEGIFKPKRWGFDIDGLHKLIYHAIQGSPLDSRRTLYRNIYLAGGASLLPGLVERLELELSALVASSVQVRVRISPWRDHAAYIGAQILAGGIQFEQQLIKDTVELDKFIRRLYSANF